MENELLPCKDKILYIEEPLSVDFLIPTKNKKKYLSSPIYHNENAISKKLRNAGFSCDGIDGYISIEKRDYREINISKAVKIIKKHYNLEVKEVERDFWFKELMNINPKMESKERITNEKM